LQADVEYKASVDGSSSIGGSAPPSLLRGIAAKLGLSGGIVRGSSIVGTGLYWGITDDSRLAQLKRDYRTLAGRKGGSGSDLWIENDTTTLRRLAPTALVTVDSSSRRSSEPR
jgi:hypothetical protein